ncbi:B12-binding domain-containing radical SAM protein [Aestuariivivens sediminicola]|uniref:B12-binding domain-containing radical SAM protein n=1 Tax=Aestuariivivens sediminicola TaxID=2913560 RepID=UPI001F574227|nr:radical SAM protein [Aestuariivivens sediminicola]
MKEDAKESKIMRPYPPLGLLYISAYLKKHGLNNEVFDSTFYSFEEQLQFIEERIPKIIGIYTNLMTKINVIKLVKTLKNNPKYGFPKIIIGGPDVTYNRKNYLNTGADFLVIGEGEVTMLELCSALLSNKDFSTILGIAYLKNGNLLETSERPKIKDLNNLPIPNRHAIDFKPYLRTWKTQHGKSSMTISTQRGCPYTCKWCSTAVYGVSYRRRPARQVVEEIKLIMDAYNPDALWFVDDVFTVSHKWIAEFHNEMIQNHITIPFEIITRAERLNDLVLQQLKEIGCYRIWIGAESGSQNVIDAMDRRVKVKTVKDMIQKTNAFGMESGTFIMLGYPGETEQDINETIQYLKEANPTHYTITIAYPIKGTSLYNEIENNITERPNWEVSTDREIDFKRTYNKKYYKYAVRKVVNEIESYKAKSIIKRGKLKMKSIVAGRLMKLNK